MAQGRPRAGVGLAVFVGGLVILWVALGMPTHGFDLATTWSSLGVPSRGLALVGLVMSAWGLGALLGALIRGNPTD